MRNNTPKRKERVMKPLRLLLLFLIALALLTACGGETVADTPRGTVVEYETLTLRWDEVKGAKIYTVLIEKADGESETVELSRNYYSLDGLPEGKYTLSVAATSESGEISPFSPTVEFIGDKEWGLTFKLVDGEYEVVGKGEATGVIEIPETYRQRKVTSVGERAFFGSGDITEVKLPESIRKIGAFAFASCSSLETVNLPVGLLSLGESAFSGCRMLSGRLSLPEGITEIPKSSFAYCSSLREISFGDGVTAIGEKAFTDLSSLTTLTLPRSLKSIGGFAFAACSDLEAVEFPDGLLTIGEFAFSKALSLTEIELPDSLTEIGTGAFYHSSKLSSVTLGSRLSRMGDSAFLETAVYNASPTNEIYIGDWFVALKDTAAPSLSIKDGTVGIADSALYANSYIAAVELPDSVKYIGASAFAVSNIVSIVTGSGVLRIGDQAFLYCERLVDVALGSYDYTEQALKESSLEYIGNYAFMNCEKLARIKIPDTVTDIGSYAFRNTDIYNSATTGAVYADRWIVDFNKTITESVTVERGTVGIARYAFYGCDTLVSIKLDGSVKHLSKGAFYNCTALESVDFPDTLTKIGDYAFYGCGSLKLTRLPPMLREIGRSAFYMCGRADNYAFDTDADTLEIPASVTYIGDYAFFGCGYRRAEAIDGKTETAGIDIVIMGNRLEYIGKCAFREFASLKSVVIGGAKMIGDKAFYECQSLETVSVGEGLTHIGRKAFYRCSSLLSVKLPSTLESIGSYAFYKCESLETAELGEGLSSIGDHSFSGCILLENIRLPRTLTVIGEQAFRDCRSLAVLTLGENVAAVGDHAFYACDSLTLYMEAVSIPTGFGAFWNSTFLPTVFGCETADGYVASLVTGEVTVMNNFSDTLISPPEREGYIFLGWSEREDSDDAEYSVDMIKELAAGKRLYAVYAATE